MLFFDVVDWLSSERFVYGSDRHPPSVMHPSLSKPHWLWGPGLSRQLGTPPFRHRGEAVGKKKIPGTFCDALFE